MSQVGVTITDVYAIVNGAVSGLNVPSSISDLENDSGFITSSYLSSYYTKTETDALLSSKADTSALSTKQDLIDASNKLDYALLSGTPTIPTKTSDLTNDSNYATSSYVDSAVSSKMNTPSGGISGQFLMKTNDGEEWATIQGSGAGDSYTKAETDALLSAKQNLITNAAKLDYSLLSGVPAFATETYVTNAISGKADTSAIPLSTSQLTNNSYFPQTKSGGVLSALNIDVVDALPVDPDSSTIYFVRASNA